MHFAEKMEFENAQMVKERLEILEDYQTHSMVVNAYIDDVDVLVFSRMNLRLMSITLKLTMVPLYNPLPPKLKNTGGK